MTKSASMLVAAVAAALLPLGAAPGQATPAEGPTVVTARKAAAPKVTPKRPLPRESTTFRGRLGTGKRKVVLQRRVDGKWRAADKGRTKRGRYVLRTRTLTKVAAYRVVAPRVRGQRKLASDARKVRRLNGRTYWHWDDLCRGSSDPKVYEKNCRRRDSAMRRGGKIVARDFHTAWRRGDTDRMQELVTDGFSWEMVGDTRAVTRSPDCGYDAGWPRWYCWTEVEHPDGSRDWMGYPVVVEASRPALPLWRVSGVAPDA